MLSEYLINQMEDCLNLFFRHYNYKTLYLNTMSIGSDIRFTEESIGLVAHIPIILKDDMLDWLSYSGFVVKPVRIYKENGSSYIDTFLYIITKHSRGIINYQLSIINYAL